MTMVARVSAAHHLFPARARIRTSSVISNRSDLARKLKLKIKNLTMISDMTKWFLDKATRFGDPLHPDTIKWLQAVVDEAEKIDPATAEMIFDFTDCMNPYGIAHDEEDSGWVGRTEFARNPGSEIWVWFGDLPEAVRDALWARPDSKYLRFPYGLPGWPRNAQEEAEMTAAWYAARDLAKEHPDSAFLEQLQLNEAGEWVHWEPGEPTIAARLALENAEKAERELEQARVKQAREDVRIALLAVSKKFGLAKAMEVLASVGGAKGLAYLADDKIATVIAATEMLLLSDEAR
jgi:hypothetical protein